MRHYVSDVEFSPVEVSNDYQPKLVPANVEHGASAHLIRCRVHLPNVGE
jgi:hypothetical protein